MTVCVTRGTRVSSRRGALLLGTALGVSIAVLAAAVPNRALAADECGAAPTIGSPPTVTCTVAGSPYPGVEYTGVEDLTVVLEGGVVVDGAVELRGSGDLAVNAAAGSSVASAAGLGVEVISDAGDVTVNAADVTAQDDGIVASATLGSVSVTSGTVVSTDGRGVEAWARAEGTTITVGSGSVTSYREGIYAYSGEGGHADIAVTSGSVSTSGFGAAGVFASASYGDVTIASTTVATAGADAAGIHVRAHEGDVEIESGTVETAGDYAAGIEVLGGSGAVTVVSGSVSTTGASASGIDVYTTTGSVSVTSESVSLTGGFATYEGEYGTYTGETPVGIDVSSYEGAITIASGDVSVLDGIGIRAETSGAISVTSTGTLTVGDGESGLYGEGFAGISVDSWRLYSGEGEYSSVAGGPVEVTNEGTIQTYGGNRTGVSVDGSGGLVTVTNDGSITTHGYSSDAVNVHNGWNGDITVANNEAIHTYGGYSAGIHVGGEGGLVTVSNAGSIVTEGYGANAIEFHTGEGALALTSTGTIETFGDYADGVEGESYGGGAIDIDVASISTAGYGASGIDVFSSTGAISITAGTVTLTGACDEDCSYYGGEGEGVFAAGVMAASDSGDVTIDVGTVTTAGHYVHGVAVEVNRYGYGEGEYSSAFGDVSVTAESITTAGDWAAGIQVVSGLGETGEFGEGPPLLLGALALEAGPYGDVFVDSGSIVTSGTGSVGISVASVPAEDALGFWSGPIMGGEGAPVGMALMFGPHFGVTGNVDIESGSIVTTGDGAVGVYASSGYTLGIYGEGEYSATHDGGDVSVVSGEIETSGDGAMGLVARSVAGDVTVDSGSVVTGGAYAGGILVSTGGLSFEPSYGEGEYGPSMIPVLTPGGAVSITSGSIETTGYAAAGVTVMSMGGDVTIDSGSIDTEGDYSGAIQVYAAGGAVTIDSGAVTTLGDGSAGISVAAFSWSSYGEGEYSSVDWGGDIHVESASVTTSGDDSGGIQLFSGYGPMGGGEYGMGGGDVYLLSGAVSTTGDYSTGIYVAAAGRYAYGEGETTLIYGDVEVRSGTVTTAGTYSDGIQIYADLGSVELASTSVVTTGLSSRGVVIEAEEGDVVVTSGVVTTSGDRASYERYVYDGYGEGHTETVYGTASHGIVVETEDGDVTLTAQTVTVSGDLARGVLVDSDYGDLDLTLGTVRSLGENGGGVDAWSYAGDVNVTVTGTVLAADGTALAAGSYYGDVTVDVNAAVATGEFTSAVAVNSIYGDVQATVGSVQATGEGMNGVSAQSIFGDTSVTVTGATTSAEGTGVAASSNDGAVDITLAAGSVVRGATGIYAYSYEGTTITINGTVVGTDGFAIDVKGAGAATIHNLSNTVVGGVSLTGGDDEFDNTGSFLATIDSDFGAGDDTFDNTGLLQILPGSATPGTIVFQGLETFDNAGTVDLANGHTGDVFDLSSATWNGLAGSTLEMDVSGTGSDTLLVGDATGQTTLVLTNVGAGAIGDEIELVVSGSDETGDEFVIDGDNGFIHYGLTFDPTTDTWSAVGAADTEVFEPGRVLAGAQNFWAESGDAWSARMTELRDVDGREGVQGWAQVFGGEQSEDRGTERFTVGGVASDVNLSYDQTFRGFQTGLDWSNGGALLGVTVGFGDAEMRMASGNTTEFNGFNLGAYGAWTSGPFFVNGLVKADTFNTNLGLQSLGETRDVDGRAWGAKAEAGWTIGGAGWFAEPTARLAWVDVDMDGFSAAGGTVDFGDATSLRGEVGGRIGARWTTGVADLVPYVGVYAVDEFAGENQTVFGISGDSFQLTDAPSEAYGRVDFGVTAVTLHGLEGFVKGEALVGGDAEGYSARLGVRWRW